MKIELQSVFPEKSGQHCDTSWGVPKVHGTAHTSSEILSLATTQFTDTNALGAGHKPNVKDLQHSTNRKDKFMCISKYQCITTETQIYYSSTKLFLVETRALGKTEQGSQWLKFRQ